MELTLKDFIKTEVGLLQKSVQMSIFGTIQTPQDLTGTSQGLFKDEYQMTYYKDFTRTFQE